MGIGLPAAGIPIAQKGKGGPGWGRPPDFRARAAWPAARPNPQYTSFRLTTAENGAPMEYCGVKGLLLSRKLLAVDPELMLPK